MFPAAIPKYLARGEGSRFVVGDLLVIKATTGDTGGAYALYEAVVARGRGMPPHLHRYEDEACFVLEGTFAITVGERTIAAGPGAYVFGPRGVPHAFRNVGEAPGRLLVIVSPGALQEQFIAEVGHRNTDLKVPKPADTSIADRRGWAWLATRAEKYGVEFLPPERQ